MRNVANAKGIVITIGGFGFSVQWLYRKIISVK